jgi:glycosyltransferase involved in cell wall biosynthesis
MRILLVASIFPPQNAAGSLRTYGFAHSWAVAGADVTVLTTRKQADHTGFEVPAPQFRLVEIEYQVPCVLAALRSHDKASSAGKRPASGHAGAASAARNGRKRSGVLSVLRTIRSRTGVFGAARMPDLTDFWIRPALRWAKQQPRWDAVVSSSGPYTTHLVARALHRADKAGVWSADFRDLWCGNPGGSGLFPFTLLERFLERRTLHEASIITTVSEPLAKRISARARKPVHVVPSGSVLSFFNPLPQERAFPDDGLVRLLYTGTVYPSGREPDPLLKGIATLRQGGSHGPGGPHAAERAAKLRLVVAGDKRDLWIARAAKHGVLDLLDHVGEVSRRDAWHMQRDADALLLLDWSDPAEGVITSKVFEYFCAGPPIIATGSSPNSLVGALLRQYKLGVHVGSDPASLPRLLADLIASPESFRRPVDPDTIEHFSMKRQAAAYLDLLREVLGAARPRPLSGG